MLKVRFSEKSKQLIVSKSEQKNYFELLDTQAIDIFLPNKYTYQIVNESETADICIVGIQHTDNSLLRSNEYNIFLSVENFSVGRTHYQHLNKFNRSYNPLINTYIYNDIPHPIDNIISAVYCRVRYFNSIYSSFEAIRNSVPFENKKFCLFTSRNGLNNNKQTVINQLAQLGQIDFLDMYDSILKDKSCYNSPELIQVYSQYKFIICFENSKTDGYVTEKIFNVFLSGAVAIYDGAPNITDYIVPGSFIQYDNNIVKKVAMLASNKVLYNAVLNKDKTRGLDYSAIDLNIKVKSQIISEKYHNINSYILSNNKILFFDIFARNNEIIIISPVYNDFNIVFKELKLLYNDTILKLKNHVLNDRYERISILIYKLENIDYNTDFNIKLKYNDIILNYNLTNYSILPKYNLTQTTLFKDDYKLIEPWYNYYVNQGVESFYLYYNGILNDEIRLYYNLKNINLFEWNFPYWNNNISCEHVAQIGQINHALYKYGKVLSKYMIFNDYDEYMHIPKIKIYELINLNKSYDTYMFLNRWSKTIDNIIPNNLPNNILLSTKLYEPTKQSKCIHNVLKHDYIGIHFSNNLTNILFNEKMYLLHFINFSNPDRNNDNKYIEHNII